jgi:branched-subunit amino acid transport protein
MRFYLLFGLLAIALLIIKGLFLCFVPNRTLPSFLERSFRYITPAVLAALIAPSVFYAGNPAGLEVSPTRLTAGLVAFAVALLTRNILITIAIGMALLWGLSCLSA